MNIVPIDIDNNKRERMRYLLKQLSMERLEREDAAELKQLLLEESQNVGISPRDKQVLLRLIEILDDYIAGRVNLMLEIHVSVSNII